LTRSLQRPFAIGNVVRYVCAIGAALLAAAERSPAQAPERFTAWTRPDFPVAEYVARRSAVLAMLDTSAVLLVPSAEGTSSGETFRQADDFEYFVGLEVPRALLLIDKRAGSAWLLLPAADPNFSNSGRPNDFPGRPLAADPSLRALSGVDSVLTIESLPALLQAITASGRRVMIDLGRGSAVSGAGATPFDTPTAGERLAAYVRRVAPSLAIDNAVNAMAALRMVKSPREIALVREAARVTSVAIARGAARVRPGIDERTLTGDFVADCSALGAQRVAFTPIIKSGANSLWPWRILGAHYDRRNRTMARGDLVIFDVGCERDHYVSDVGRTFPVNNHFSARQRVLIEMVRRVSDAVIAAARPGVTLTDLQAVALAAIPAEAKPYMQAPLYFGHHIGLDAGDPSIASAPLAAGMVFTIEPWYYNHDDNVAVFLEDEILITNSGSENLTAWLPRDADGLEALRMGKSRSFGDADAFRSLTRDGTLSFAVDRELRAVRVYDLLNGVEVARTLVCAQPFDGQLSPDDVTFTVRCGAGASSVRINSASHSVVPALAARAKSMAISRAPVRTATATGPPRTNEVIVIGMIHGAHRTSSRYSTDVLRRLLVAMRPDYVLTEIAPNRFDQAMREFAATGTISEPRVARFPEYVDVLFPLTRALPFTIVPTAGWTHQMDVFRTTALKRIAADPSRRAEWMEYDRAIRKADSIVGVHGADNPFYLNSAAYDSVQTAAHEPYNRLFNAELGPGGWDNINRAHFGNIARALDAHRGEGRRIVIMYGAGHKEWFMRALRTRDDVTIREVAPFLERIGAK